MSKVSKIYYIVKGFQFALNSVYVKDAEDGVCGFYATLHTEYCYSSHSYRRCQRCHILLYSVYSGLSLLPGGKAICYSTVFKKSSILGDLAIHHQSV